MMSNEPAGSKAAFATARPARAGVLDQGVSRSAQIAPRRSRPSISPAFVNDR